MVVRLRYVGLITIVQFVAISDSLARRCGDPVVVVGRVVVVQERKVEVLAANQIL